MVFGAREGVDVVVPLRRVGAEGAMCAGEVNQYELWLLSCR